MGKGGGMRWTEEQLAAHKKNSAAARLQHERVEPVKPGQIAYDLTLKGVTPPAPKGKAKLQALGRLRDGSMNKTETRYAAHLDVLKHQGNILWWAFEGIKLRLADRTHITIDFAVMTKEGFLQMHDVKGAKAIVEDDARAKTKIAAQMFPFAFFMVYPDKASGGWTTEEV